MKWTREGMKDWKGGERTERWGWFVSWWSSSSSRLLLTSTQEKRDNRWNVDAQIDSPHNLLLSALVQRIVLHSSTHCFFKNTACHFSCWDAICSHILTTTLSHYFRKLVFERICPAVWSRSEGSLYTRGYFWSCQGCGKIGELPSKYWKKKRTEM